ncbi:uncharacterized protein PF3D7_1120000-like [Anabrus simplex]|uniref:uncharacterized protein PF3D7_1120000-like n=1 Tax=Anabrus simplex TaxID=316456 RepID=UPI0035A29AA4
MARPVIHPHHLRKSELQYELAIRGLEPVGTVSECAALLSAHLKCKVSGSYQPSQYLITTSVVQFRVQCEMDLEIKIKEEPAWLEGKTTASLEKFEHVSEVIALKEEVKSELTEPGASQENSLEENFEHVSEVIALKEEVKSELTEPESLQENSLEPSEDTKEGIFIEEHTDDQLLPYIKEETKLGATVCGTPWVTGGTCGD